MACGSCAEKQRQLLAQITQRQQEIPMPISPDNLSNRTEYPAPTVQTIVSSPVVADVYTTSVRI